MRSVAFWYDVRLPSPVREKVPAEQGDEGMMIAVLNSTMPCSIMTTSPSSVGSADSFSLREKQVIMLFSPILTSQM